MFEDSLLELDAKRKKKSGLVRFIVLPLAILIHLAAGGAFGAASDDHAPA